MTAQTRWELINPEGVIQFEPQKLNPHPANLEGKTVLLRWNGKHNGDVFLNRIAELLNESVRNIKIIKGWEVIPESRGTSENPDFSTKLAKNFAEYHPDISIGSQGD